MKQHKRSKTTPIDSAHRASVIALGLLKPSASKTKAVLRSQIQAADFSIGGLRASEKDCSSTSPALSHRLGWHYGVSLHERNTSMEIIRVHAVEIHPHHKAGGRGVATNK